jgi:hypothetical protein
VSKAKNFARIICVSETGNESNNSIVFVLFSSEIILIVSAGINIINIQGKYAKNGFIEAEPTRKISFTYKKLATAANKTMMIYPIGLFR